MTGEADKRTESREPRRPEIDLGHEIIGDDPDEAAITQTREATAQRAIATALTGLTQNEIEHVLGEIAKQHGLVAIKPPKIEDMKVTKIQTPLDAFGRIKILDIHHLFGDHPLVYVYQSRTAEGKLRLIVSKYPINPGSQWTLVRHNIGRFPDVNYQRLYQQGHINIREALTEKEAKTRQRLADKPRNKKPLNDFVNVIAIGDFIIITGQTESKHKNPLTNNVPMADREDYPDDELTHVQAQIDTFKKGQEKTSK